MRRNSWAAAWTRAGGWLVAAALLAAPPAFAAGKDGPEKAEGSAGKGETRPDRGDAGAAALIDRAEELIGAKEFERGVKMLETVIDRYPESPLRYKAYLILARHYLSQHKHQDALRCLHPLTGLGRLETDPVGEMLEVYLEGLYLTGVCNHEMRQYDKAFPPLRRITSNYPNTVWANQAYFYIGLSHFAQQNWTKAIESLNLVGTFVDPDSPAAEYGEAGRRFYVKVMDADLPILNALGREVTVDFETSSGDKESTICIPLAGKGDVYIGSLPTEIAPAKPDDKVLQVFGGDVVMARYYDENTQTGERRKLREAKVRVVSTASLTFSLGTYEGQAPAAFLKQPLFVAVRDADKDVSANKDEVIVKLLVRYKEQEEEEAAPPSRGVDLDKLAKKEEEKYRTRDELVMHVGELENRCGRFGASVLVTPAVSGVAPDRTDQVLHCAEGDEILASYIDERHIGGETPREVQAKITVSGEIENNVRAIVYHVTDPLIMAQKNTVEATAYLELGRIFSSMGLLDGARVRCDQGLDLVNEIIRSQSAIPNSLRERAFQTKWELEIVKDDLTAAIATCQLFNKLFSDSPLVDQALMGIGEIRYKNKEYRGAVDIYQKVLALPQSQAKAEALFRIAQAMEAESGPVQGVDPQAAAPEKKGARKPAGVASSAIAQYKTCAERYPDSPFAGEALAKVVDYYQKTRDYAQADDLLQQIIKDHPDAAFLDQMLLKWALIAFRMGNYEKAYQKCTQLIFEYPNSRSAEDAKKILPSIEKKRKGEE